MLSCYIFLLLFNSNYDLLIYYDIVRNYGIKIYEIPQKVIIISIEIPSIDIRDGEVIQHRN